MMPELVRAMMAMQHCHGSRYFVARLGAGPQRPNIHHTVALADLGLITYLDNADLDVQVLQQTLEKALDIRLQVRGSHITCSSMTAGTTTVSK